jgi:N-glycosylase/DNA lyase
MIGRGLIIGNESHNRSAEAHTQSPKGRILLAPSSTTTQEYFFEISRRDVRGPMNLEETILSAQTSEPEWAREGASFVDVEEVNGTPVKYTLSQVGGVGDFRLNVRAISSLQSDKLDASLRLHLTRVLGLGDDLDSFYGRFSDEAEPLQSTFSRLRGLRLMRGTNLFESLICSILSQNNSALLWNRTARLLMHLYGVRVNFPDSTSSFLFPKPETLAGLSPRELRSKTSMGYRAKPVVKVSRLIVCGKLKLDDFGKLRYEEAMEILLGLPGVGPKVADCFLLYGAGRLEAAPVDVWIHRIATRLYFRGGKVSRLKTAKFLRDRFGEWAGYAQLYLFDFARRGGMGKPIGVGKSRRIIR